MYNLLITKNKALNIFLSIIYNNNCYYDCYYAHIL